MSKGCVLLQKILSKMHDGVSSCLNGTAIRTMRILLKRGGEQHEWCEPRRSTSSIVGVVLLRRVECKVSKSPYLIIASICWRFVVTKSSLPVTLTLNKPREVGLLDLRWTGNPARMRWCSPFEDVGVKLAMSLKWRLSEWKTIKNTTI